MNLKISCGFFFISILLSVSWNFAQDAAITKPSVTYYGTFIPASSARAENEVISENGVFRCTYGVEEIVQGKMYDLKNLQFYADKNHAYTLKYVPGDCMDISNTGFLVCYRHFEFREDSVILYFFSKDGTKLLERSYTRANLFGFSATGNKFGAGTPEKFEVITLPAGTVETYPAAVQFDISADEHVLALGSEKTVSVYSDGKLTCTIPHDIPFFREVKISPDNAYIAFIGKNELFAYDIPSCKLKLSDKTKGEVAFADLRLTGSVVWAGIHQRNKELTSSKGILKTYNLQGGVISEEVHSTREAPPPARLNYEYKSGEVPWPFKPFDSPAKAWNSYLQLSSSSDGSTSGAYLHQGFDMDVPSNIETYPVVDGYVKAVLTLGGDIYWRVAVSDIQTADSSEAWLYAHLDQNSITVKSGDQVKQGVTLLGKVIPWSGLPGGHLHFSRIKSKGTTWNGSWRNCANPMFYLRPHGDTRKPGILFADGTSKFAYSTNDGSGTPTYLKPDNLSGSIDIIVKVSDTCGQSTWNQAATSIFYWIKDSKTGNIVFPRTLVFVRGQGMPDYSGSLYNDLAPIMHRIDSKFPVKGWFTHERIYAHVITNSHGDTDIAVADKSKALDTKKFNDGTYWIVVEVGDAAGNITIDSQEVSFKNGISGTVETTQQPVTAFALNRIFPVSPTVMAINFQTPKVSPVTITIFDLSGKKIKTLVDNVLYAYGTHTILWNGANTTGATVHTGTYLIVMNTDKSSFVKKLLYY